jgi:hypothetical protein
MCVPSQISFTESSCQALFAKIPTTRYPGLRRHFGPPNQPDVAEMVLLNLLFRSCPVGTSSNDLQSYLVKGGRNKPNNASKLGSSHDS